MMHRLALGLALAASSAAVAAPRIAVVASVPAASDLVEGVAADAASGRIFASDVHGRRILVARHGRFETFVTMPEGAGSPMAMMVDPKRRVLLVAVDQNEAGSGGLLRVRLSDRTAVWVTAPGVLHLGDVTVSRSGTAYLADARSGAVYRCPPGCAKLETLLPPGRLRSGQGMIVSPDESWMWVADYARGLVRIDLRSGEAAAVQAGAEVQLRGIDGMALDRGRVIAVQNGRKVARLLSIGLSDDGRQVTEMHVLAEDPASLPEPTQVSVSGGRVLLVANAQWGRLDEPAERRTPAEPTRIVAVRLARD